MRYSKLAKSLVCLMLVAIIGLLPITAMAASKAYILSVTNDKARLRDSTGESSTVIRNLSKGTKLLYTGSASGQMYKVYTTDGKVGYVYRNYLTVYGAIRKNQIYITTTATPVYKKSGRSLKKYTSVSANRYLMVIGKNSSWAYVRTITGKAGYVRVSAIKRAF